MNIILIGILSFWTMHFIQMIPFRMTLKKCMTTKSVSVNVNVGMGINPT